MNIWLVILCRNVDPLTSQQSYYWISVKCFIHLNTGKILYTNRPVRNDYVIKRFCHVYAMSSDLLQFRLNFCPEVGFR